MLALAAPNAGIDTGDLDDFIDADESQGRQRSALLVAGLAGLGRIDGALLNRLNAWRFGLSMATGLVPPKALLDAAPGRLRAWQARAPMLGAADRIDAARIAAGLGVFSSQSLIDLYAQVYDATDPSDLGSTDAWKLRQAFVGKDRETRLSAIRQLVAAANQDPLQRTAALAMVSRAAMLVEPDPELQDIAPELIAAMLAGGYDRAAARWGTAINQMDDAPRLRSWALLALSAPGVGIDTGDLDDFIGDDESEGMHRSALLVAGLAGMGRIDGDTLNRLNARHGLGLGRKTAWSEAIDQSAVVFGHVRASASAAIIRAVKSWPVRLRPAIA